eukprot:854225-Alexandrium_andersonii.AAC.1
MLQAFATTAPGHELLQLLGDKQHCPGLAERCLRPRNVEDASWALRRHNDPALAGIATPEHKHQGLLDTENISGRLAQVALRQFANADRWRERPAEDQRRLGQPGLQWQRPE